MREKKKPKQGEKKSIKDEEKRRKMRKKEKEEKEMREENEGVLRNEMTRTAKNPEMRYKR